MKTTSSSLLGSGLYPLTQAARLIGEEPRTVRRWLKGYSWAYQDGRHSSGPLWALHYADDERLGVEQVLSFDDLLELRAVSEFVKHGVSLRVVRATIEEASKEFGPRPLHQRGFMSDGRRFFYEAANLSGEPSLVDFEAKQRVFGAVIRPSLFAGIDYGPTGEARRWFPVQARKVIVLDPRVQFGEPIIAESGVPTDAIAAAVKAEGGDRKRVATLYHVTAAAVDAAVQFESRLAA